MLALSQMGMSNYQVGMVMNRSPHTIKKYCESPLFTDPKFAKLIEEYKEKELIDLTSLTMVARARLHELAPTMNPIESIALMDRSFQQRRLLEGKSTENISSLRRIITEAHEYHAIQEQSTSAIPVRQGAPSGEGVRVEDAQYQEPAAARSQEEEEEKETHVSE